jgi:hypothetical protein
MTSGAEYVRKAEEALKEASVADTWEGGSYYAQKAQAYATLALTAATLVAMEKDDWDEAKQVEAVMSSPCHYCKHLGTEHEVVAQDQPMPCTKCGCKTFCATT